LNQTAKQFGWRHTPRAMGVGPGPDTPLALGAEQEKLWWVLRGGRRRLQVAYLSSTELVNATAESLLTTTQTI
jgi:hypothetical protein